MSLTNLKIINNSLSDPGLEVFSEANSSKMNKFNIEI